MVDLAPFVVDLFEVSFVFKVQVPRDEHVLLLELSLTYTLLSLQLLLEGPHVNQANSASPYRAHQLPNCPEPLPLC